MYSSGVSQFLFDLYSGSLIEIKISLFLFSFFFKRERYISREKQMCIREECASLAYQFAEIYPLMSQSDVPRGR